MDLSRTIASLALLLSLLLVVGYARAQPIDAPAYLPTAQKKVEEREMKRREAMAEQQRRRDEFEHKCRKPLMNPAELEDCRLAYRQL